MGFGDKVLKDLCENIDHDLVYCPQLWVVLEFSRIDRAQMNHEYKVFGSWAGGFANGDEWRMNSGINKIEDCGDHWIFHGYSGSAYRCFKGKVGTTRYTSDIVDHIQSKSIEMKPSRKVRIVDEKEIYDIMKIINSTRSRRDSDKKATD